MANGHGGKRPGSGRKKGYRFPSTLNKEAARQAALGLVLQHLEAMLSAQIENAKGVHYATIRTPQGTYVRATDTKQIDAAISCGGEMFKLYTKEPSPASFQALWDRTLDKPIERTEVSGKDGGPLEIKWKGE